MHLFLQYQLVIMLFLSVFDMKLTKKKNNVIIKVLIITNINIINVILNIINNKILFVSPSVSKPHVSWPKNCLYMQ
jgi:hypothetical protein